MKHPKTKIAIRLKRQDRTLERNRFDAGFAQRFHDFRQPIEQRAVFVACPIEVHTKSIEDVLRDPVRGRDRERMPGEPGQPMVGRHSRKRHPVDAVIEHPPDYSLVLIAPEDSRARQEKLQLRRHRLAFGPLAPVPLPGCRGNVQPYCHRQSESRYGVH